MTETTTGYVPGAPDITRDGSPNDCRSEQRHWLCTRPSGHPMPHAAGTGQILAAIWDDEGTFAQVEVGS